MFVTDDRKEDWWLKIKGETIRPREELIKEFYDETGYRILIYQADIFLKFAKEKLKSKVKDGSIDEVKEVRLEDERAYEVNKSNNINLMNYLNDFNDNKKQKFVNHFDFANSMHNKSNSALMNYLIEFGSKKKEPQAMDLLREFYSKNAFVIPDNIKKSKNKD